MMDPNELGFEEEESAVISAGFRNAKPARDWYSDADVMNGALAWTPTLETITDFMGVKQLKHQDLNFMLQKFKMIRCLIPVTYFKLYFTELVEEPVYEYERDDAGKPIFDSEGKQKRKPKLENGNPVVTKVLKRVRRYKSGEVKIKGEKDNWETEGLDFELLRVNDEEEENEVKVVIGRKPTVEEIERVEENTPIKDGVDGVKVEVYWALDHHHTEAEIQKREVFYRTPKRFLDMADRWWRRFRRENPDWIIDNKDWVWGGLEAHNRNVPQISDRFTTYDRVTHEPIATVVTIGALDEFEFLHFVKYFADHYFFNAKNRYTWQLRSRARTIRRLSREEKLNGKNLDDAMEEDEYNWWSPDRLIDFVNNEVEKPRRFDQNPDPDNPNKDIEEGHTPADRAWNRYRSLDCLRHIERLPRHVGYMQLDWSDALIKYPTYEELRDLPNGHFRMSRNGVWKFSTGDYSMSDAQRAVGDDWGGRESKGKWKFDWVWARLDKIVPHPEPLTPNSTEKEKEEWVGATKARRDLMMAASGFTGDSQREAMSAFYQQYGSYRETVCKGAGAVRGLLGLLREGRMITANDLKKDYLPVGRNYEYGEWTILARQVALFCGPRDIGKNQNGFDPETIMVDLNSRIPPILNNQDGTPKLILVRRVVKENIYQEGEKRWQYKKRCDQRYVSFYHMTEAMLRIWENQPVAPIVRWVEERKDELLRENARHFRPELDKMFSGVPISAELRVKMEQWYEESDERIWDFVYWDSEAGSGKKGLSNAQGFDIKEAVNLCKQGFGLGYGTLGRQQSRQERLYEVGLKSKYYTTMKGILEWWSVYRTCLPSFEPEKWPSNLELKKEIAGHLKNRSLTYGLARDVLWDRLKIKSLINKDELFPFADGEIEVVDWAYVNEELDYTVGNEIPPKRKAAREDSEKERRLLGIIGENHERLIAIQKGKFFQLNQTEEEVWEEAQRVLVA